MWITRHEPHAHPVSLPPRGFALVSAIFLLVVLVSLGAFMVSISNSQQTASAQDIQGSRALAAARSGVQWAAGTLRTTPASCTSPMPNSPLTVEGFNVAVNCTASAYTEGTDSLTIFRVVATASAGGAVGSLGYVERQVAAFIEF